MDTSRHSRRPTAPITARGQTIEHRFWPGGLLALLVPAVTAPRPRGVHPLDRLPGFDGRYSSAPAGAYLHGEARPGAEERA